MMTLFGPIAYTSNYTRARNFIFNKWQ